jgi:sugar phosphate isomerase/epimerase
VLEAQLAWLSAVRPGVPFHDYHKAAERVLAQGLIDLKHSIGLLNEIQFEGPVSLELFNKQLWQANPADVLSFGFERLSALIA